MKENISEEELAVLYADGNRDALAELIKRCKTDLFGFLLGLTGRPDASDDIFQDVFLKFAEKPKLYKPKSKFRAWLFSVARNSAMDYFRKMNVRREISLEHGSADDSPDFAGSPCSKLQDRKTLRPDLLFENSRLARDISEALASLPRKQREIFYMRHYSGLSFKEISEMLGEPVGTLLSRMSRAAAALRAILEDEGY